MRWQMNHLIRIYEQRKHKVDVQKRKIVYFVSGGVYSFLFLSTVIVKLNYYEANILSYSAANVLALGVSLPFSILGLLFILFVLGLGYVIIFDEVLFRLTSGQRNRNSALLDKYWFIGDFLNDSWKFAKSLKTDPRFA